MLRLTRARDSSTLAALVRAGRASSEGIMTILRAAAAASFAFLATTSLTLAATYGDMSGADLGVGANLNGAIPFPANNAWNRDVSKDPVDPNSDNLIASIGLDTGLHPDFGSGTYAHAIIG